MKRTEKLQVIEGLVEKFATFSSFYVVDAMGLTVEQVNKFRKNCVKHNLTYQVAKNTFIKKALELSQQYKEDVEEFTETLRGFSGIVFSNESGSTPARMLKAFWVAEKLKLPLLKAASIEGDLFIGAEHMDRLSSLKSKNELLGDIITCLRSPVARVVALLQSGENRLMSVVETLSKASS